MPMLGLFHFYHTTDYEKIAYPPTGDEYNPLGIILLISIGWLIRLRIPRDSSVGSRRSGKANLQEWT